MDLKFSTSRQSKNYIVCHLITGLLVGLLLPLETLPSQNALVINTTLNRLVRQVWPVKRITVINRFLVDTRLIASKRGGR
jgi:hypothetical protein